DLARSLTRHGLHVLAVANAHLDPAHVAALEAAVAQNQRENGARIVFPDVTKRPWALRLTEEFRSGACHAGRYESSIVLAVRPELVREAIRRALPSNPRSLSAAIRSGQTSFEEAGGPRAYFGSPADAEADEGVRTIEILGAILAEALGAGGEHRGGGGAARRQVHRRLQRREARGHRLHALGGGGGRWERCDGERRVPWVRRHGHDPGVGGPHRDEDRDVAAGRPARGARGRGATPADLARGGGPRGARA